MKNICIVGCGKIGWTHSRRLSKCANLFFHSLSRSSADRLNQEFNGRGVYQQLDEVASSSEVDAVVISSPPEFHKDQIIYMLRAGKSVLVEKPMCVSDSEIKEIEKTVVATDGKPFLMVAENYYYKPSLKKIKQLLKKRFIGEVHSVRVRKEFKQPTIGWKTRCGALLEGGIHFIALLSAIFDDTPEKIEASFPGTKKGEVERNSITKLTYKNNASAQLSYSWNTTSLTKGIFQHSYIIGDKGFIVFESNGLYLFIRSNRKTGLYIPDLADMMGYQAMTNDFVICLNEYIRTPYSDFHKAKRDLSIVFQAYNSLSA